MGLLQRRLVDLELIFVWPSLVSGFFSYISVTFSTTAASWIDDKVVLRLLLDLLE